MTLPALILAAGRGERMRPLTDHTPKPLLTVQGKPLIEWHLAALARDGVREVVINTAWLEDQFPSTLGDGSRWGLHIHYSMEARDHGGALETAGGIANALPWLGDAFWVLAGDVFAPDFQFDNEVAQEFTQGTDWAHLWMVRNPTHNPAGDFAMTAEGRVLRKEQAPPELPRLTYSTIGLYRAAMVQEVQAGSAAALRPCLDRAIDQGRLSAAVHEGRWVDVGTPARLAELNEGWPDQTGR